MKKCVFFDRDGIVNVPPGPGYVENWAAFELLPEFVDVLRAVHEKDYEAVVITNQRGVARGIMTAETLEEIHENLQALLRSKHGLEFLDILSCTHGSDEECDCRKPKPGMILMAAEKHGIDLGASWMIGDSERDVKAGQAAGCRTILVSEDDNDTEADFKVADMHKLKTLIAKHL